MDNRLRDEKGRFIKEHSGNPNGRPPKALSLTAILIRKLRESKDGDAKTRADELVENLLKNANAGNAKLIKEIFERVEGRVPLVMKLPEDSKGKLIVEWTVGKGYVNSDNN